MTEQEKVQYIQYMTLKDELDAVAYGGVELKLDGLMANANDIATCCVFREDTEYMRDYRRDGEGYISELNFDPIRK